WRAHGGTTRAASRPSQATPNSRPIQVKEKSPGDLSPGHDFVGCSLGQLKPIQRPPAATVTQLRNENTAIILASGLAATAVPVKTSKPIRPMRSSEATISAQRQISR